MKVHINKDPVSSYTHFGGFIASVIGLIILIVFSLGDQPRLLVMSFYGVSLVFLFLASTCYHFFDLGVSGNVWLRRLDHTAIFMLIAGTYLPPLLHTLDGNWRISMFILIATIAAVGIIFKLFWVDCPRWLSVGCYLTLGWIIVIPGYQVLPKLSGVSLFLLVLGGLIYSTGAIIYALKKPDPIPDRFGFHEIWHIFVLLGALSHYFFTLTLFDVTYPPFS